MAAGLLGGLCGLAGLRFSLGVDSPLLWLPSEQVDVLVPPGAVDLHVGDQCDQEGLQMDLLLHIFSVPRWGSGMCCLIVNLWVLNNFINLERFRMLLVSSVRLAL